jgi:thioredoxin reductase
MVDSLVEEIGPTSVTGVNVYSGARWKLDHVDTVVLAMGYMPASGFFDDLRLRTDKPVFAIGDCVAPRTISDAVFDGHRLARALGHGGLEGPH